jgi:hypothetical protein
MLSEKELPIFNDTKFTDIFNIEKKEYISKSSQKLNKNS